MTPPNNPQNERKKVPNSAIQSTPANVGFGRVPCTAINGFRPVRSEYKRQLRASHGPTRVNAMAKVSKPRPVCTCNACQSVCLDGGRQAKNMRRAVTSPASNNSVARLNLVSMPRPHTMPSMTVSMSGAEPFSCDCDCQILTSKNSPADPSMTERESLLTAALINRNIGLKAVNATTNRAVCRSKNRLAVSQPNHRVPRPNPIERSRMMWTAKIEPVQGNRSAAGSWKTRFLFLIWAALPMNACRFSTWTSSRSAVSTQLVAAAMSK